MSNTDKYSAKIGSRSARVTPAPSSEYGLNTEAVLRIIVEPVEHRPLCRRRQLVAGPVVQRAHHADRVAHEGGVVQVEEPIVTDAFARVASGRATCACNWRNTFDTTVASVSMSTAEHRAETGNSAAGMMRWP